MKTENHKAWEVMHSNNYVSGGTFLPAWGLYSSGSELTESLLKIRNNKILEIACGIGESVSYISEHSPSKYVGIDFSEHALEEAKKNYQSKDISFVHTDMSKELPFDTDSFDEV